MKKALSLFLAILMMFGCCAIAASATNTVNPSPYHGEGRPANYNQCVVIFDAGSGTFKNSLYVYDLITNSWSTAEAGSVKGKWAMVPQSADDMVPGFTIKTPVVTAPSGYQFDGWYCNGYVSMKATELQGFSAAANSNFTLPANSGGEILQFTASYSPTEPEEDTMATVLGVLTKVFGAILGIIMYRGDTEAGVAMVEKLLGGVLG